jgi:hypothetical protein
LLLAAKCQSVAWSGFASKGWHLGEELDLLKLATRIMAEPRPYAGFTGPMI